MLSKPLTGARWLEQKKESLMHQRWEQSGAYRVQGAELAAGGDGEWLHDCMRLAEVRHQLVHR